MWFQPIIDLYSGKVYKVEALARIQINENHFLTPNQFLSEFGEQELKILFKKGLHQSLSWLKKWEQYQPELGMSINLSPITIHDENFVLWIEQAVQEHQIEPHKLTLEILENEKLNIEKIQPTILKLTQVGVKLAIDDFGAGYSSINRLALLPIDTVKIDQSLIREIIKDPLKTIKILNSIAKIGKDFSKHTIIEGLENQSFIEVANILGIHYGQGYGLAKPMKAEEFSFWLQNTSLTFSEQLQFTTWLGAFAYFWKNIYHQNDDLHKAISMENCLLTKFFELKNMNNQEFLDLHAKFHEQKNHDKSIHNQMLNFLIIKIFEENMVLKK
jgi:EAL domain-containing protein (putative c-di-GMP-specific phosphodiesterase class I)